MKREYIILALVLLLVVPTGAVSAGPGEDGVSMENYVLLAGETYTIHVNMQNASFNAVTTQGPIKIQNRQVRENEVAFTIKAKSIGEERTAQLFIKTSDGERRVDFRVVPYQKNAGNIISNYKEDAQKWREFKSQWIKTRIDRKQTGNGLLVVYEQKLYHKGGIDPKTGQPTGQWVQVPVNETTGEPKWFYNNPNEAMAFMARQAHDNRKEEKWWVAFGLGFPLASLLGQFVVLPRYRDKKERSVWEPNGGNK